MAKERKDENLDNFQPLDLEIGNLLQILMELFDVAVQFKVF